MNDDKINWNEVESAVAEEDGLHVTKKDGTLGVVSIAPVGQNLQRLAHQQLCKDLAAALNNQAKALYQLLETQKQAPAGAQAQLAAAIANVKANIAALQDIARKNGCG